MSLPKLHPTVRYAEPDYWDSRYEREPSLFEWFFGHTALRRIIRACISKKKPVLQVGCGTSNLQEGMAQSGYTVINTDISAVVIKQMRERHAKYSNLEYLVSDCRDMPEFRDCQFGHVIDKGTMDALLCCKQGTDNVFAMLSEIHRVLQPGGSFLLVTLGDPTRRLPLLFHPKLQWKVSLLLLPKISAAAQAHVDGKPINDTTHPITAEGPYEVVNAETIAGLPANVQYSNYFFAYVCKKQPLQLPMVQGERGQLPNGWVAGSKELFSKLQKELDLPEDLLRKGRRKRVMHVPAGSTAKLCLPGGPASCNSSSSSNAATAMALGICPAQDLESIMQQDQSHLQEFAASSPSVARQKHQQPQQAEQVQAVSASNTSLQDVRARHQSAPNLAELAASSEAEAAQGQDDAPQNCSSVTADSSQDKPPAAASARHAATKASPTADHNQHLDQAAAAEMLHGHVSTSPADNTNEGLFGEGSETSQIQVVQTSSASFPDYQQRPPSWLAGLPATVAADVAYAASRAPRVHRVGPPAVRRFSTECSSQSPVLRQQVAMLRQQQAQHSECAADGLVMHDVSAVEGSERPTGLPTSPAAPWGHTRPPKDRRLSNMSVMSGMSVTSTSISNTEEEEDLELVEYLVSYCSSRDNQQPGQQQLQDPYVCPGSNSSGSRVRSSMCAVHSKHTGTSCVMPRSQGQPSEQAASLAHAAAADKQQLSGEPSGPDMQTHQSCDTGLHVDAGTDSLHGLQQQISSLHVTVVPQSGGDKLCLPGRQPPVTT